jgi:hypothetical protein
MIDIGTLTYVLFGISMRGTNCIDSVTGLADGGRENSFCLMTAQANNIAIVQLFVVTAYFAPV